MIKTVEMNRVTGTAKTFDISTVHDGYIRIYGGTIALGRRCANKRRDELSVSVDDFRAALADYDAAQAGAVENKNVSERTQNGEAADNG
jgi:hypothetical protein